MFVPEVTADFRPIERLIIQSQFSNLLTAALEMRVFDHLPATADGVTAHLGCRADVCARFLDVLAAIGLLERRGDTYHNTPTAQEFLASTSPAYRGAELDLQQRHYETFSQSITERMMHPDHKERDRTDTGWASRDALESLGNYALCGMLQESTAFITALPGFSGFRTMCDVGGNHGYYSMALLDQNPGLTATVCDLPSVADTIRAFHAEKGYADRMTTRSMDLRTDDSLGADYDLVFASHVLYGMHDAMDAILGKVTAALTPGGWFVACHCARPEDEAWHPAQAFTEFLTVLSGYPTHHLDREVMLGHLHAAGLTNLHAQVSPTTGILLLAGQKPA
ncbi:methyltransferase dimerization domain-containing protein [Desulfobaculum sp. SPO524]|uniref:methyltransferase family protein n=1 Tax=Desulfobaculum sp. SPO524 TaxID=3378071 RepID=UPI0038523C78